MKLKLLIPAILFSTILNAQQSRFIGIWEGKINVGINLRIAFHFRDSSGTIITTMDSPDQSAYGMATDYTYVRNDSIFTGISKYKVSIAGLLTSDSTISASFKQGVAVPLELKKVLKVTVATRPQTPVAPFSYNSEDVSYSSIAKGITIAGTLTSPKTDPNIRYIKAPTYPAILLITGSGPQNRDEAIMGHKPFAVIADYLTKKGFIVLRVDDRGTGKSSGNFNKATSADFADDVTGGINYLKKRKDVDTTRIGLLGHSEGGMIAPMVAAKRRDIDFLVLLAGVGIKPIDLMTEQNLAIFNTAGISKKTQYAYGLLYEKIAMAIVNAKDSAAAVKAAAAVLDNWLKGKDKSILTELHLETKSQQNAYTLGMASSISGPWYKYFLTYDPAPVLKKVNAKVLAINGDKDIQVLSKSNLAGIEAGLKQTRSVYEIHEIPGVNHLFQNCVKCTVNEYGELDETISPKVLELIGNWLTRTVL